MSLLLVNSNRMRPPIAPIGLDYVGSAARGAGIDARLVDLCLEPDGAGALRQAVAACEPRLVGISFRNSDDSFWPTAASFVSQLAALVAAVRGLTAAPIVLGGVGNSVFAAELLERAGADFGIRGDGERALIELWRELTGSRRAPRLERVPGLLWRRRAGGIAANPPAWEAPPAVPSARDFVDNRAYFRLGGQAGFETKRGCARCCSYCVEREAKGDRHRLRDPRDVAAEVARLAAQGVDVLHTCDSEFNLPREHALAVCAELERHGLGDRVRWYAYAAVLPFDGELARAMRRAGCAGVNFGADSAWPQMLDVYAQPHRGADLERAVRLCREHDMAVMLDLLLGGPGETRASVRHTIEFVKRIDPDCAGAALGLRLYPRTPLARRLETEGALEANPGIRRRYGGPIDLCQPTYYISPLLGAAPAAYVRELVEGDIRFFEPLDDPAEAASTAPGSDYNYSDNDLLAQAIAAGARGAYWHILRRLRG